MCETYHSHLRKKVDKRKKKKQKFTKSFVCVHLSIFIRELVKRLETYAHSSRRNYMLSFVCLLVKLLHCIESNQSVLLWLNTSEFFKSEIKYYSSLISGFIRLGTSKCMSVWRFDKFLTRHYLYCISLAIFLDLRVFCVDLMVNLV